MALHHIFNEDDASRFCPYCKNEIPENKWSSTFNALSHYKTTQCDCGRFLTVKVQFHGSGHDAWNDQKPLASNSGAKITERKEKGTIRTIEDHIQIIEEKKTHS